MRYEVVTARNNLTAEPSIVAGEYRHWRTASTDAAVKSPWPEAEITRTFETEPFRSMTHARTTLPSRECLRASRLSSGCTR